MKKFWSFQNRTEHSAELLLYGDIAQSSWYGDEVTAKQFAQELDALGPVEGITVRINSGGGDVFAAQAIGNLLEAHSAAVTGVIDGLCASAATIVACHCDYVVAAQDATYMIHPVQMGLSGYYSGDELKTFQAAAETVRESIAALYARKTGHAEEDVCAWMDATSWWTAQEAQERGFVDEVMEGGGEKALVENRGGVLFVNRVDTHLAFDQAPKFVQDSLTGCFEYQEREETKMDVKTVEELRAKFPELMNQAEEEARGAERERIRKIQDMEVPGCEDLAHASAFDNPVSPETYAMAAMARMKKQGSEWLIKNQVAAQPLEKVAQEEPVNRAGDEILAALRQLSEKK